MKVKFSNLLCLEILQHYLCTTAYTFSSKENALDDLFTGFVINRVIFPHGFKNMIWNLLHSSLKCEQRRIIKYHAQIIN